MEKILWLASPTDSTLASSRAQSLGPGLKLDFAPEGPWRRPSGAKSTGRFPLRGKRPSASRCQGVLRLISAELALGGGGEVCPSARLAQAASLPPLAFSEVPIGHR